MLLMYAMKIKQRGFSSTGVCRWIGFTIQCR